MPLPEKIHAYIWNRPNVCACSGVCLNKIKQDYGCGHWPLSAVPHPAPRPWTSWQAGSCWLHNSDWEAAIGVSASMHARTTHLNSSIWEFLQVTISVTLVIMIHLYGRMWTAYAKWTRGSRSDNANFRRGSDDPKGLAWTIWWINHQRLCTILSIVIYNDSISAGCLTCWHGVVLQSLDLRHTLKRHPGLIPNV